jgi:hypothetical protein
MRSRPSDWVFNPTARRLYLTVFSMPHNAYQPGPAHRRLRLLSCTFFVCGFTSVGLIGVFSAARHGARLLEGAAILGFSAP